MNEIFNEIYLLLDAALSIPVYDHAPQDAVIPFAKVEIVNNVTRDTDTELAFELEIQVLSFSRYKGIKEIAGYMKQIYDALHQVAIPNTTSYGVTSVIESFSSIITEQDGETRRGAQRFIITYEQLISG